MEERSEAQDQPASEAEAADEITNILIDEWHAAGELVARFEEDGVRGALYLITPEPQILAMVKLYNKSEWPDVREDEVRVWWEGSRCWASVRGRRRYIDVQIDALQERGPAARAA